MSSSGRDRVLQAYIQKFGKIPTEPNQLVSFSRADPTVPTIIYSDAKKSLAKITKSIKSGKRNKSLKTLISGPKWQVGDEVLISKDRTGVLHYIGKVPEMEDDNLWYGIELTSGTLGHNDGSIKGKRYFQTQGKRGMFVPEKKLRRRLNRKDKERRNSYASISSHVKELQKEYGGDDAGILYPSSQLPIAGSTEPPVNPQMTTLIFENPKQAEQYGNNGGQYQSTTYHEPKEHRESTSSSERTPPKKKKKKPISKKKMKQRRRSGSGHSSTSQQRKNSRHDRDESEDTATSDESDVSELDDDDTPTVKTFDTLLKYILRQKGQYREGLLDVYANPQTHTLIAEAFSQMKQLQPAQQQFLWPALLKRWAKYTHTM